MPKFRVKVINTYIRIFIFMAIVFMFLYSYLSNGLHYRFSAYATLKLYAVIHLTVTNACVSDVSKMCQFVC